MSNIDNRDSVYKIDNCEFGYKIERQIQENEEEFIYTLIEPFCETVVEQKLSKEKLKQILEKGMQKSIPLDKVKKAKEEIENINPVYSTIGDRIPVLKNYDDIKAEVLEILDKLIAESEGVNETNI